MKPVIRIFSIFLLFSLAESYSQWHDITRLGIVHDLYGVHASSDTNVYVSGWNESGGVLMKTTNAGKDWRYDLLPGDYPLSVFLYNADIVFVAGLKKICECAFIKRTTNKGTSWDETIFDDTPLPYTNAIISIDTSDGYVFVTGYNGAILKSQNLGNTWFKTKTGTNKEIFKTVKFIEKKTGFAISGKIQGQWDEIYKTTDAGENWFLHKSFRNLSKNIGDIFFKDENNAVLFGSENSEEIITETTDGGLTWKVLYTGKPLGFLFSGFFNQDARGFAFSDRGKILETNDKGKTWGILEPDLDLQFLNMFMYNNETGQIKGYAVGKSGIIFKFDPYSSIEEKFSGLNSKVILENHNPDFLIFRFEEAGKSKFIKVYNYLGEMVSVTEIISSDYYILNMNVIPSGIYFYHIYSDKGMSIFSGKFEKF